MRSTTSRDWCVTAKERRSLEVGILASIGRRQKSFRQGRPVRRSRETGCNGCLCLHGRNCTGFGAVSAHEGAERVAPTVVKMRNLS